MVESGAQPPEGARIMAAKKTKKVNKSAVTGRFVSKKEVKAHPKTTFRQTTVKKAKKKR